MNIMVDTSTSMTQRQIGRATSRDQGTMSGAEAKGARDTSGGCEAVGTPTRTPPAEKAPSSRAIALR
ncbi:unnamed protein product, partial [Iphiclides podalirius]